MTKIYLSGAITGRNYENTKQQFKEAEKLVKSYGKKLIIYNPMRHITRRDFRSDTAHPWEYYMRLSLRELADTDVLVDICNDSENSKGVMCEKMICTMLKIPVYNINNIHRFFKHERLR